MLRKLQIIVTVISHVNKYNIHYYIQTERERLGRMICENMKVYYRYCILK
jgi:hypothetical protein